MTPPPRKSCSSATAAPVCAAKLITAAVLPQSRWRNSRAVPYLVLFAAFCLFGLLATCALL